MIHATLKAKESLKCLYISLLWETDVTWNLRSSQGSKHLIPGLNLCTTQINHAGEGGLYGELIQDRSFDALAATSGFDAEEYLELTPEMLSSTAPPGVQNPGQTELKHVGATNSSLHGSHDLHGLRYGVVPTIQMLLLIPGSSASSS